MELREYQKEAIEGIKKSFKNGNKRVILCLPTGAGKTVTFVSMIKKTLEKDSLSKVLVLTDRMELLHQAGSTFEAFGVVPELITSRIKKINKKKRLFVAMVETIKRRLSKDISFLPAISLMIIDEAHTGNFMKLLKMPVFEKTYIVGATATPLSTSKKDPLKNYYSDIVIGTTIPELIRQGFLCNERAVGFKHESDLDLKKDNKGEFTSSSQYNSMATVEIYAGLLEEHNKWALGKKTIIFCSNIKHTEETANVFIDSGLNAKFIHSKNNKDRDNVLRWFKNTPDAILVNCGILTKGFDEPSIECVILNRATTSRTLYYQMIGRAGRKFKGKDKFTLIDMGLNVRRMGRFWSDDEEWGYLFENPPKPGQKEDVPENVKECPECFLLVPIAEKECPECGHIFITKNKFKEKVDLTILRDGIPEEVDINGKKPKNMNVEELIIYQESKGYKKAWLQWFIINNFKGVDSVQKLVELGNVKKNKDFGVAVWVYKAGEKNGGHDKGIEYLQIMGKIKGKKEYWHKGALSFLKKINIV